MRFPWKLLPNRLMILPDLADPLVRIPVGDVSRSP